MRLTHPNIVPLLGITFAPLQLISYWMSPDLPKYIEKNSDADRLELVGVAPADPRHPILIRFSSYLMSLRASAISTRVMSFTATSKEYVVVLNFVSC
jgi:hypothetical protein